MCNLSFCCQIWKPSQGCSLISSFYFFTAALMSKSRCIETCYCLKRLWEEQQLWLKFMTGWWKKLTTNLIRLFSIIQFSFFLFFLETGKTSWMGRLSTTAHTYHSFTHSHQVPYQIMCTFLDRWQKPTMNSPRKARLEPKWWPLRLQFVWICEAGKYGLIYSFLWKARICGPFSSCFAANHVDLSLCFLKTH